MDQLKGTNEKMLHYRNTGTGVNFSFTIIFNNLNAAMFYGCLLSSYRLPSMNVVLNVA